MGLSDYLPSKKFQKRAGIILGVFVIGIVGVTVIDFVQDEIINKEEDDSLAFSNVDTDGDGLRDWEEDVWGTDPENPDTDGDGLMDGEEVLNERDPNKNGSDRLTESRLASVYSAYKQKNLQRINITEQISNKILPHSLLLANELETSGSLSDTAKTDLLIRPIVSEYQIEENLLTIEDLNIVDTDNKSLVDYFTFILTATNELLENPSGNETSFVLSENNVDIAKKRNNYNRIVELFYTAKVPSELAIQHVAVLNNFVGMRNSFELLVSADENDPAKSIFALEELKRLQYDSSSNINILASDWRNLVDKYEQ